MSVPAELREAVRRRANYSCDYCGATETGSGGELTVDHFRPRSHGGADESDNLIYCCYRCNLYKADYWPTKPDDPSLWNPLREPMAAHLLVLADGTLFPITPTGSFTLRRLRLNRPPLVAHRLRRQSQEEGVRLLSQYRNVLTLLEQMQRQHAELLDEHRALLEEQRALLKLLLRQ